MKTILHLSAAVVLGGVFTLVHHATFGPYYSSSKTDSLNVENLKWVEAPSEMILERLNGEVWNSSNMTGRKPLALICFRSIDEFESRHGFSEMVMNLRSSDSVESHILIVNRPEVCDQTMFRNLFVRECDRQKFGQVTTPGVAIIRKDGTGTEYYGTSASEVIQLATQGG